MSTIIAGIVCGVVGYFICKYQNKIFPIVKKIFTAIKSKFNKEE